MPKLSLLHFQVITRNLSKALRHGMMAVSDKFFALAEGLIGYISHWVYKKIWNIWSVRTDWLYFICRKSLRLLLMEHLLDDILEEFKSEILNLIVILSIIFD